MKTQTGRFPVLTSAVLLLAVAGCTKPETAKPAADLNPAGKYTLASVDGKPVPCALNHEGHSFMVKSGSMDLGADHHGVSRVVFSVEGHPDATRDVNASYTQAGNQLTLQWEGAGVTFGSVEPGTFTMTNEGMVFVYRK
ncbi:MAG: hypothetical protein U1F98_05555 [Verrucomicrobiota bacterium]